MSAEAAIIEIIKWIRESIRPVVVILIVSALALFLPCSWLTNIGIAAWLQRYRPFAILFFAGSLVWLASFPVEQCYYGSQKKKRLHNLASNEQEALRPYILNKKTVHRFIWSADGGIVAHLEKSGIFSNVQMVEERSNYADVSIDLWTHGYLFNHPELVGVRKISN
jgi:hypothetical protein